MVLLVAPLVIARDMRALIRQPRGRLLLGHIVLHQQVEILLDKHTGQPQRLAAEPAQRTSLCIGCLSDEWARYRDRA